VGVVAAGHPATVEAAVEVLRAGGNAFDAAVAAGFAAAIAEPGLSSLAGGGFLLARTGGGEEVLFDFFVDTPGRGSGRDGTEPRLRPVTVRFKGADQVFHVGHGSVAVPGCLAGYLHVHHRLGRLPLAEVVAPATALARDGVVLGPQQAGVVRLLEPILTASAEGRARYLDAGGTFTDTSVMTMPNVLGNPSGILNSWGAKNRSRRVSPSRSHGGPYTIWGGSRLSEKNALQKSDDPKWTEEIRSAPCPSHESRPWTSR
jgi:gamma-glutamyltranspeptidase / glutathione hydrolase